MQDLTMLRHHAHRQKRIKPKRPAYSIPDLAERFGYGLTRMREITKMDGFPKPSAEVFKGETTAKAWDISTVTRWMNENGYA